MKSIDYKKIGSSFELVPLSKPECDPVKVTEHVMKFITELNGGIKKALMMYEDKETRTQRHKEQATNVNKQFAIWTDERPEKHDYRHANMKAGFRNGAINYHKHMGWLNG